MNELSKDSAAIDQNRQPNPSGSTRVEKQQHAPWRRLLSHRFGWFSGKLQDGQKYQNSEATKKEIGVLSQEHLKDPSSKEEVTISWKRDRLIRFNSIVSVVEIPSRSQYSNSARRLLWGEESSGSFSSEDADIINNNNNNENKGGTTEESQENDDFSTPEVQWRQQDGQFSNSCGRQGRPSLMRKLSFHD